MIAEVNSTRRFDRRHHSRLPWWLSTVIAPFHDGSRLLSEHVSDRSGPVLLAGKCSVVGNYRDQNEDRGVANAAAGVFLVSDGVGGQHGGAEASEIIVDVLVPWLARAARCAIADHDIIQSAVKEAIESARHEMTEMAESNPDFRRMAATIALAVVVDRVLYVTRVGDCRVYLLRDGRLWRLTSDQTLVQTLIDAGAITPAQARHHRWRHVVTNAVGVKPLDEPISVEAIELAEGDRLLLCSDGLTDVVDDVSLLNVLLAYRDPQTAAETLVECALDSDSKDNVTSVVVDLATVEKHDCAIERLLCVA